MLEVHQVLKRAKNLLYIARIFNVCMRGAKKHRF